MKNKNQKIIITKRIAMNIYLATHTDVNLLFHEAGHYFISVDTHRETHTHIQRDTQCTSCFAAKSMGKFNRALRCARNLLACWLVSIYCSFTVFECVCVCLHISSSDSSEYTGLMRGRGQNAPQKHLSVVTQTHTYSSRLFHTSSASWKRVKTTLSVTQKIWGVCVVCLPEWARFRQLSRHRWRSQIVRRHTCNPPCGVLDDSKSIVCLYACLSQSECVTSSVTHRSLHPLWRACDKQKRTRAHRKFGNKGLKESLTWFLWTLSAVSVSFNSIHII